MPSALLALALAAASAGAGGPEGIPLAISTNGFRPKQLTLRKGETARLLVTTQDVEHCFALDVFHIEKRVVPGKTTTIELTPDRTGHFTTYCCLEPKSETVKGELVVTE